MAAPRASTSQSSHARWAVSFKMGIPGSPVWCSARWVTLRLSARGRNSSSTSSLQMLAELEGGDIELLYFIGIMIQMQERFVIEGLLEEVYPPSKVELSRDDVS